MNVYIQEISDQITITAIVKGLAKDDKVLKDCIKSSNRIWVGTAEGVIACVWGTTTPTLLSDRAYIWLWTADLVKDHPFVFIRKAQMVIKDLIEEYGSVFGVCEPKATSVRWLKLLGAKFDEPSHGLLPFSIRKAS